MESGVPIRLPALQGKRFGSSEKNPQGGTKAPDHESTIGAKLHHPIDLAAKKNGTPWKICKFVMLLGCLGRLTKSTLGMLTSDRFENFTLPLRCSEVTSAMMPLATGRSDASRAPVNGNLSS